MRLTRRQQTRPARLLHTKRLLPLTLSRSLPESQSETPRFYVLSSGPRSASVVAFRDRTKFQMAAWDFDISEKLSDTRDAPAAPSSQTHSEQPAEHLSSDAAWLISSRALVFLRST